MSEAALPGANDTSVPDLLAARAVIEQAKGIVMATYRCGPDDASDLLYKSSQGLGVKVHVLAARLVELAAHGRLALSQIKDLATRLSAPGVSAVAAVCCCPFGCPVT